MTEYRDNILCNVERSYIYTIGACKESLDYAIAWLVTNLEENDKGGIVIHWGGYKSGFCAKHKVYWKAPIFKKFMPSLCKYKKITIKNRHIKLTHRKMDYTHEIFRYKAFIAIYPGSSGLEEIEDAIAFKLDRNKHLYFDNDKIMTSFLVVPQSKYGTERWIEEYNPQRIDIEYNGRYEYRDI